MSPEQQRQEPDERGEQGQGTYLEAEFERNDSAPPPHDSADEHRAVTAQRRARADGRQGAEALRETPRRPREVQDEEPSESISERLERFEERMARLEERVYHIEEQLLKAAEALRHAAMGKP